MSMTESDVIQFIHETEKQFKNRFVIGIAPLCNCKHHIWRKNNGYMSSQGIIGQTPALLYQMQMGFTVFEKHLYIPAFPINTDDFFRWDSCVRADDGKPVFPLALVPDTDDFCRNCFITNGYINRKQVLGAASALLGKIVVAMRRNSLVSRPFQYACKIGGFMVGWRY